MDLWVEPADERKPVWPVSGRIRVDAACLQALEHALVESDPQVLGVDSRLSKARDEVWKRRRDQVEPVQHLEPRRTACDLADDKSPLGAQGVQLLAAEEPQVLEVDHLGIELRELLARDAMEKARARRRSEARRQPGRQSTEGSGPVLARPRASEPRGS